MPLRSLLYFALLIESWGFSNCGADPVPFPTGVPPVRAGLVPLRPTGTVLLEKSNCIQKAVTSVF